MEMCGMHRMGNGGFCWDCGEHVCVQCSRAHLEHEIILRGKMEENDPKRVLEANKGEWEAVGRMIEEIRTATQKMNEEMNRIVGRLERRQRMMKDLKENIG